MLTKEVVAKDEKVADKEDHKYNDYSIEEAVRTLMRAEEHKSDPKMMEHVHQKMKKQHKVISSIKELRKVAKAKPMDDLDGDGK